jgi:hypothetical protein
MHRPTGISAKVKGFGVRVKIQKFLLHNFRLCYVGPAFFGANSHMNLSQLKIFYRVIRRGSLTAAAAELNITQAIQWLQAHYDVRLVERSGKNWELTAAGKALYRLADRIFQLQRVEQWAAEKR